MHLVRIGGIVVNLTRMTGAYFVPAGKGSYVQDACVIEFNGARMAGYMEFVGDEASEAWSMISSLVQKTTVQD